MSCASLQPGWRWQASWSEPTLTPAHMAKVVPPPSMSLLPRKGEGRPEPGQQDGPFPLEFMEQLWRVYMAAP